LEILPALCRRKNHININDHRNRAMRFRYDRSIAIVGIIPAANKCMADVGGECGLIFSAARAGKPQVQCDSVGFYGGCEY